MAAFSAVVSGGSSRALREHHGRPVNRSKDEEGRVRLAHMMLKPALGLPPLRELPPGSLLPPRAARARPWASTRAWSSPWHLQVDGHVSGTLAPLLQGEERVRELRHGVRVLAADLELEVVELEQCALADREPSKAEEH